MSKFKFIYFLALIPLILGSCRKDINDFIKDPSDKTYAGGIFGIVVDEQGHPVKDAKVLFAGETKTTDENGVYQFKNVNIHSRHNLITIRKDGYFEGSRVFSTDRSTTITVRNVLLEKSFDQNFDALAGATVKKGNISLEFPADAVVNAADNLPYYGNVLIAMKYLNPEGRDIYFQMPGDLVGINAANEIAGMTTYGMVAVELQSPSGQRLQIAPGKKVKMTNKLSQDIQNKCPSIVPLWYYDEVLGYWKEDGEAKLIGDTYVGEVSHFTYWNYDSQAPSIILSSRIVDQNGDPIPNADVWVVSQGENSGGHGMTNSDGSFSGKVAKDVILNITVSVIIPGCNMTEIYHAQIGPYTMDVTLPDIVATLGTITNANVTATVVDCDGNPLQNGYVEASSSGDILAYLQVNNGSVNGTIVTCQAMNSITFVAFDVDNNVKSDPMTVNTTDNLDLGMLSACGNLSDFVEVKVTDLGIDTTFFSNIDLQNNTFKVVWAGGASNDSTSFLSMYLYWMESNNSVITPGTYNIFPNETQLIVTNNNIPVQTIYIQGTTGTVTVTQGGSQPGDVVTGMYNFIGTEYGTTITHQINGSFRMTMK